VRTKLYHLAALSETQAVELQQQLSKLSGVREVLVVANEAIACIKVDMQGFDEAGVEDLINKF
jgi:hypothetical protein